MKGLHIVDSQSGTEENLEGKDPYLVALGERIRNLRSRRGLTRKATALAADISERHLANLELGNGNASILVLQQVAFALQCSLAEITSDMTTSSPEWLMIRELLEGRSETELYRARVKLTELFGSGGNNRARLSRIALIGLRGAGKSTLGHMLAEDLGYPFIELSREIEKVAGCSIVEIHSLYGASAYRRYERRALEEAVQIYPEVVIATPGGLVSDATNFNLLLSHCYTVWLQADPEDHMKRVVAQGDFRPMSGSREAMNDLKHIISGRAAFYAKADLAYNTSGHSLEETFTGLRTVVRNTTGVMNWAA
ncbi:helix-turn-helix transcriptional regulator [Caldimonas tepidiphila]|uniref:helix-turn-helix transcriptional regulator n=1 Tax=Caldimonas tepidiphila TaxID=2315841 RepID=UPI000E5A2939|nr:helix-turn-helix transcriptional regulator [Caldimonas tepidiphila]